MLSIITGRGVYFLSQAQWSFDNIPAEVQEFFLKVIK